MLKVQQRIFFNEFLKYGSFAAALGNAKSAEDMKRAINAVALPAGSYRIKRNAFSNISLNAFAGITGGAEWVINDSTQSWENCRPNLGPTASVGISLTWGGRRKINSAEVNEGDILFRKSDTDYRRLSGRSWGLFVPVVDLGAVVLYRFGSSEPLPRDVTFQQVFAPGLMFQFGFGKLPITLLAGGQYSPRLRSIDQVSNLDAVRFNLSATIDIPLFNFYTKTDKN